MLMMGNIFNNLGMGGIKRSNQLFTDVKSTIEISTKNNFILLTKSSEYYQYIKNMPFFLSRVSEHSLLHKMKQHILHVHSNINNSITIIKPTEIYICKGPNVLLLLSSLELSNYFQFLFMHNDIRKKEIK